MKRSEKQERTLPFCSTNVKPMAWCFPDLEFQHHTATKYWSGVQRQQYIAAIQKEMDRAERLLKQVEEDQARERAEGLEE